MTALPPPSTKKLGLVIDLDTCVGCHACAVAYKEWNAGGIAGPLTDEDPYGKEPFGVWFNRVHSYEVDASFSLRAKVPKVAKSNFIRTPLPRQRVMMKIVASVAVKGPKTRGV